MRNVPRDKGQTEAPSSIDFKEETIMKKSKGSTAQLIEKQP